MILKFCWLSILRTGVYPIFPEREIDFRGKVALWGPDNSLYIRPSFSHFSMGGGGGGGGGKTLSDIYLLLQYLSYYYSINLQSEVFKHSNRIYHHQTEGQSDKGLHCLQSIPVKYE